MWKFNRGAIAFQVTGLLENNAVPSPVVATRVCGSWLEGRSCLMKDGKSKAKIDLRAIDLLKAVNFELAVPQKILLIPAKLLY